MTTTFKPEDCRPFNLEHARAGAPICLRSGEPVTIIKWDLKNKEPIIGSVLSRDNMELVYSWPPNGSFNDDSEQSRYDLVMKPIDYIDGRPVHVGDVLINGQNLNGKRMPEFEFSFTVGAHMAYRLLHCYWPEPDDYEDEPEPQPDTVTLTKSDIAHVVWAYKQLTPDAHSAITEASAQHLHALREIAVKHGGLMEGKADLSFVDDILPESFPVKFAAPVETVVVDTLKVPPSPHGGYVLHRTNDDFIPWSGGECPVRGDLTVRVRLRDGTVVRRNASAFYWKHSTVGDDFKDAIVAYKVEMEDHLNNQIAQQAETIRKLTEANTALEDRVRAHLEDNAKMDKALDEQMAETGRWMAEAKRLGDLGRDLIAQRDGYLRRVEELNGRLSNIAAYVRNDAAATSFQNMSSYRAAVLSKVLD